MLCKSPFMIGPLPCACSRCMPCRVNRKRLWTFRLEMEAKKHVDSCVATLTYNDYWLPKGGSLVKEHGQKFIRSLRKVLAPSKIRYFLVGEYGEDSHRPHFHVLLFGVSWLVAGGIDGRVGAVKRCWKYGNIQVDMCKPEAIAYVAGYVTKKLNKDEREGLGLAPEFTRMSLRPGIGAGVVGDIAAVLRTKFGMESVKASGDVPYSLRFGSKTVGIGRYLRGKLREELFGSRDAPVAKTRQYWAEMYKLRREAAKDKAHPAKGFGQYLVDMNAQKILNVEAKSAILVGSHKF